MTQNGDIKANVQSIIASEAQRNTFGANLEKGGTELQIIGAWLSLYNAQLEVTFPLYFDLSRYYFGELMGNL